MRAESFRRLLVAGIDGDESLALKLVDDEVVEVAFIVGGVGNKERALFEAIEPLELFNEFACDCGVGGVIGEREGDQRDSFFGDNDMGAIPPKEDEAVLLAVDLLIGIV